jgi:hypothetical protein
MLVETQKTELPTGHFDANVRHTHASYSRPRSIVDQPQRKKRGKGPNMGAGEAGLVGASEGFTGA